VLVKDALHLFRTKRLVRATTTLAAVVLDCLATAGLAACAGGKVGTVSRRKTTACRTLKRRRQLTERSLVA
jgi:hypothetical protein